MVGPNAGTSSSGSDVFSGLLDFSDVLSDHSTDFVSGGPRAQITSF